MTDGGKVEDLRFSRSGRVLRKTLKRKEMEEIELEESRQEKVFRRLPSSIRKSPKMKTRHVTNNRGVHKVSWSNSSESSSALCPSISDDNSFGYESENCHQEVDTDSKNSSYFQTEDDNCSMDNSKNWNSYSSTQESDGSTDEAYCIRKSQKYRLEANDGRGKFLKNVASKRKITKSSHSVTRKSVDSNKGGPNHSRNNCSSRKKTRNSRKGAKFPLKLFPDSARSPIKSSHVKSYENARRATGQFSDRSTTSCDFVDRSVQSLAFNVDTVTDSEQVVEEHPLGTSPIDVAAHLKLLGDNLTKIGLLVAQRDSTSPGVLYVLLVSLLSAVGPLLCLTKEIPGLEGMRDDVFVKILDHIAYIMPGLE